MGGGYPGRAAGGTTQEWGRGQAHGAWARVHSTKPHTHTRTRAYTPVFMSGAGMSSYGPMISLMACQARGPQTCRAGHACVVCAVCMCVAWHVSQHAHPRVSRRSTGPSPSPHHHQLARELLQLALGQATRVHRDAALGASVRDVHHRRLPRHERGQAAGGGEGRTGGPLPSERTHSPSQLESGEGRRGNPMCQRSLVMRAERQSHVSAQPRHES